VGSCTSFGLATSEFDAVAGLEDDKAWPDELTYRHDPLRYPWVYRQLDALGFGAIFRVILRVGRTAHDVENPSGFARERLWIMVDRAAGDLHATAMAVRRLLLVAELDEAQPMNQAVAVLGLGRLMESLDLDPMQMRFPDPSITTQAMVEAWISRLDEGWPLKRSGPRLPPDQREAYLSALASIVQLPHPSAAGQRGLIGALDRLNELEADPTLRSAARDALSRALFHGLSMGLWRALFASSARVRESAIRALHRLGGSESVPVILAWIAKPSSVAARGVNRYDDDKYVRLALVRMCGQLGTERALTASGTGPAPAEFLYETFFDDPDPGLRTVALEALAFCLRRDVSFDRKWAESWWSEDYVPHRGAEAGQ